MEVELKSRNYFPQQNTVTPSLGIIPNEILAIIYAFLKTDADQVAFISTCKNFRAVVLTFCYKETYTHPRFRMAAQDNQLYALKHFVRVHKHNPDFLDLPNKQRSRFSSRLMAARQAAIYNGAYEAAIFLNRVAKVAFDPTEIYTLFVRACINKNEKIIKLIHDRFYNRLIVVKQTWEPHGLDTAKSIAIENVNTLAGKILLSPEDFSLYMVEFPLYKACLQGDEQTADKLLNENPGLKLWWIFKPAKYFYGRDKLDHQITSALFKYDEKFRQTGIGIALALAIESKNLALVEKLVKREEDVFKKSGERSCEYVLFSQIRSEYIDQLFWCIWKETKDINVLKAFLLGGNIPRPPLVSQQRVVDPIWDDAIFLRDALEEIKMGVHGPTSELFTLLLAHSKLKVKNIFSWSLQDSHQAYKIAYYCKMRYFCTSDVVYDNGWRRLFTFPYARLKTVTKLLLCVSIDLIAKVASIAESIIKGLANIIKSASTDRHDLELGLTQLFIHPMIELLSLCHAPIDAIMFLLLIEYACWYSISQQQMADFFTRQLMLKLNILPWFYKPLNLPSLQLSQEMQK